jgi:hypothetical protein
MYEVMYLALSLLIAEAVFGIAVLVYSLRKETKDDVDRIFD